jgi:hypothetical protein
MELMTGNDLLLLARKAQIHRACQDEATKCYYAWINDGLMQEFNRGKEQFKALLQRHIGDFARVYCPWHHVGKNH